MGTISNTRSSSGRAESDFLFGAWARDPSEPELPPNLIQSPYPRARRGPAQPMAFQWENSVIIL